MYPSQQNATDQTSNFFWMLVLITLAILGLWWLKREWIVTPILYVRYYELLALQHGQALWNHLAALLHLPQISVASVVALKKAITQVEPHRLKWGEFALINNWVGKHTRWVITPLLFILAAITYFKFGGRRFVRTYSMQSLRDIEAQNWPQITPILSLDLVKEDIEKGPWSMAQLPVDFCKKHQMISPTTKNERNVWQLDKGIAHRVLTSQVGPLWTSPLDLPIHIKALLVIFIARADRDRQLANHLLAQISRSAAGGKLDFSGVEEALQKCANNRIIQWLSGHHAYVYTFMASLIEIARTNGVLASAEFLWLKPVDRRLWFVLNSVGRQTAVVEVAGAYSHWKTEKKLGRALRTPMIDEAVNALEECMYDTLRVDKGDSWLTFSAG